MIVKDAMVLIHLAKITLLEASCIYFKDVVIPPLVEREVIRKEHPDSVLIKELISKKMIMIKEIKDKNLVKRANEFNIFEGEAEATALYWQERADYLASDDDNVRKKNILLELNVIGTPAILLFLYKKKLIDKDKLVQGINLLREIGWFSNSILDGVLMEADKNG